MLDRRDKVGFEPPQARWLAEPNVREWAAQVLIDDHRRSSEWVDHAAVEADLRAGAWRDPAALWRALNAELWLRRFGG